MVHIVTGLKPDLKDKLQAYVGRTGLWRPWTLAGVPRDKNVAVAVRVIDARYRSGAIDVLIEPVSGSGSRWICAVGPQRSTIEWDETP